MRKPIALLAVAALLIAVGVAFAATATAGDPPVYKSATRTVELGDNYFAKPGTTSTLRSVTVKKGTILRFFWGPDNEGTISEHDVTGVKGHKFTSGDPTVKPERPFRKRITRTTSIVCSVHSTTMKLTVKVKRPRR
jgi:hypothetical protein